MPRSYALSKSRFVSGLQCHRQLWWRVHEPRAPELTPSPKQQAIFDQGTHVGKVARTYEPGGTLIDLPYNDYDGKLAATQRALATDTPAIYEAALSADNVFVAVDILKRERNGWRVIEVKSSTSAKPEHIPDAAIQVHVLRRAGLTITGADVMVLNRECTYPDLSNLFIREDVTDRVEALLNDIPRLAGEQLAMLAGAIPTVAIGPHCTTPYECPFLARCWPILPEHHISTLFGLRAKAAAEFEAEGWQTIYDLPERVNLNKHADRQRRAVQAGKMLIEGDLTQALARFESPLAFLDFETVMPAIPVWDGCHPYDQIPAQFSCHVEAASGGIEHHEWVADGPGDPRPEIARRVIEACRGARTVVAYNMSFEKSCLERLAQALPGEAAALRDVIDRLADPLPVVREHVYHPDFGGSFSLKSVLPALVPELTYEGLEIADGDEAQRALSRRVLGADRMSPEDSAREREALLRYCERDTLAMVRVVERLREMGRGE
jgi:predicted RecB family nuclease